MNRDMVRYKIEWEGGILATLDYGLHPEDIEDEELRTAWAELSIAYRKLNPLIRKVQKLLKSDD